MLTPFAPAGAAGSGEVSDSCDEAPVTLRVLSGDDPTVGGEEFEVKDAVARRVPILPDPDGTSTSDPKELERQRKRANRTALALYSL
jgi:hypothetical protein